MTATRLRRSPALVLTFDDGGGLHGFDCLARTGAPLSSLALELLGRLSDWTAPESLFSEDERTRVSETLVALLDAGFLLVEGTPAADLAARYQASWEWGAMTAHYHFGIKDPDYQGPAVAAAVLTERAAIRPLVPLHEGNAGRPTVAAPPRLSEGVLDMMYRRRSSRAFDRERPLPFQALADCLFSGLGVTAFAQSMVAGEGRLPLTMTPSGGARNPFEGWVVARAVEGLAPGVYHYSGVERSLGRTCDNLPHLRELAGGQEWFDDAAALILLVAHFERCTWKYAHPTGYRVVLLEAGHIAQNLLLTATAHGLAAAPTCALSDGAVEELLGLDRIRQAAVYAVGLGVRSAAPSPVDAHIVEQLP